MSSALPAAVLPDAIGARRLNRGIAVTWWYTATAILFFQMMAVLLWAAAVASIRFDASVAAVAVIGIGGILWSATCAILLAQYRHRDDSAGPFANWRRIILPLAFAAVFGVAVCAMTGSWVSGILPIAQSLVLLNWPRGVRLRFLLVVMAVLAALWFIDLRTFVAGADADASRAWWTFGFFAVGIPAITVMSLWWWDVLVTLDRARIAEARLGATQERLRVATDVHDLQGHHLQVIALQLELAERLLVKDDPDAALEQLRLARTSVADARQGTRDLAMRFRGVPLPDEIANAVDLLRAAGTTADAAVSVDAAAAPASVLGPVIRETTTNVLRHGGGKWARLSLGRHDGGWRYEISNDAPSDSSADDGSGLDGITRRLTEAGGEVHVDHGKGEFHVIVTVPDSAIVSEAGR
ncbi:sensor histidine kinase [Microbacterium sp.]|uniref:sensor histidine kinase n=1 Tax=Microbacterium sp. TaxID=51671 RepID=UPI003F99F076